MITIEQKRRLGIFLLISLITLILVLALLLGPTLREKGDEYLVRFPGISINGLNVGGSVKYQGVEIGKVSEITVDPEDINAILVRIHVRALFPMKENMEAKLQFLGITGIRYLEISGGTNEAPRLLTGSEIPIGRGLGEQAEDVITNVDEAVRSINTLFQAENIGRISAFLANLEKSSRLLTDTISEKSEDMKTTLSDVSDISSHLKRVAQNLDLVTNSLSSSIQNTSIPDLVSKTDSILRNLERRLSDQELGLSVSRVNSMLESADMTFRKMGTLFVSQQEEVSRTLLSLREAMDGLSRITRELSEDPSGLIRTRKENRRKK